MGIFDNLKSKLAGSNPFSGESVTFTFARLPESVDEMKALPESALDTPYKTAALTVCALCAYAVAPEIGRDMLNFLKGPAPLTVMEKQFIDDRFRDSKYVPFSYFGGATPENDYTPAQPYTLTVGSNPYSFTNENYAKLLIRSGGADHERDVVLRLKPSEGKWYLDEQHLLVGIRTPQSANPWA